MQLYVINWSFKNAEDQIFATNEFCKYFESGKFNEFDEGFHLKYIAHTPQNGTGTIICEAQNTKYILNLIKMWRENFSISFNIKPALSNEEIYELNSSLDHWKNFK